jgi:hypothetical protein
MNLIPMDHELLFLIDSMDELKAVCLLENSLLAYRFLLGGFLTECTRWQEKERSQ